MRNTAECEGCALSVHMSEAEIEEIFGKTMGVKQVKTVSEDEYKRRMALCKGCDCLLYGTTCRHCGCIVQLKAKLAAAKCPFPYRPKW